MSDADKAILQSGEIEFFISCLEPSDIENVGSLSWFEAHHRLQKLNQQSTVEAKEIVEESVKEHFVSLNKIVVLIHEAICIQVWKDNIFTELLKYEGQPSNTFIAYIILYHELTAVGILQNILFHKDAVESLEDVSIDLIDFCAAEVIKLLAQDTVAEENKGSDINNIQELKSQAASIEYNIGLSCICIVGYLVQNLDVLPFAATSRMYTTHDFPILMASLIQKQPWKRINQKTKTTQIYDDGTWKNEGKVSGISKYEGQVWIALRTLMLNERCAAHYEINDFRKQQLLKVQRHLHETTIDQISPLIELKQWLLQLSVSSPPSSTKRPLLMETIPEIRANILSQGYKKWKKIAKKHIDIIFDTNKELCLQIAKRLGETYDIDHLEKVSAEEPVCGECGDVGIKRCSKCRSEWYCGRECQVKRWPKHKSTCSMICGE